MTLLYNHVGITIFQQFLETEFIIENKNIYFKQIRTYNKFNITDLNCCNRN